jgi:hypothetical protein
LQWPPTVSTRDQDETSRKILPDSDPNLNKQRRIGGGGGGGCHGGGGTKEMVAPAYSQQIIVLDQDASAARATPSYQQKTDAASKYDDKT